ncbi:MAG: class I SAM-dependent methyltransferase [Deltaproteobacteria bacterium]|nr:class I SAM-dependent methyltransferase [Deltaproteobacteria bacterium]
MSQNIPSSTDTFAGRTDATAVAPRTCPVCGSRESSPIRHIELVVPDNFSLQHSFSVNACARCGAVFHNVRHQDDRDDYYESYTGSDTNHYQVSVDQARLNDMTTSFLVRAGLKPTNQTIVDIGCSFGVTLASLQRAGFDNLYAIDPDRAAIKYLSDRGIPGRTGLATDLFPEFENKFDLIILRHVLEHLEFPLACLDNVGKWLKPRGRIYVELPDLARFQECSPFPGYFFEFEHINHFSLVSLLNLMRAFTLIQYESTPGIYPCIRALFEKSDVKKPLCFAAADAQFIYDSFTRPSDKGNAVLSNIAQLNSHEIALWGVSIFAYRMLTHTPLRNCSIRHLVDSNPERQGERLMGLTVEPPKTLCSFSGDIVICGENSSESIEKSIRCLGLPNRVVRLMTTPRACPA